MLISKRLEKVIQVKKFTVSHDDWIYLVVEMLSIFYDHTGKYKHWNLYSS
jgi:hypothetical protein